jgi:transcriptional regulator GlxA family with amidase domain
MRISRVPIISSARRGNLWDPAARELDERKNSDIQPLALEPKAKRSEMMTSELEAVALRLFDQRSFVDVTVDEIASEARISVRTFYRCFAAKEDVLQLSVPLLGLTAG